MLRRRRNAEMKRIMQGGSEQDEAAARAFAALSAVESPSVDETFKGENRDALMENMAQSRLERRSTRSDVIILKPRLSRSSVVKRAILVPAMIVSLFVVFTGSAFALSAGANPDSSFYGTKLFFEGVQESLTGSSEAKAQLELDYAQKRIREMQYLATHNISNGAEGCASTYADNLAAAQERINQLTGDAFSQASEEFLDVTGNQLASLDSLAAEASGVLSPAIGKARQACNGARQGMMGDQQMRMGPGGMQNQPGGSGGNGPGGPGSGGDGMMQDGSNDSGGMMPGSGSGGSTMSPGGGSMQGSGGMP